MPDQFPLRRNSTSEGWRADQPPPAPPPPAPPSGGGRNRTLVIAAAVACFFLAAFFATFAAILLLDGDEDSDRPSGLFLGDDVAGAPIRTSGPAGSAQTSASDSVSLLLWSQADAAWTSDLEGTNENYTEGDAVPFLASWSAEDGASYNLELTFDCSSGDSQAIDYLTDASAWGDEILEADGGPGDTPADAAAPFADTPDFPQDDNAPGFLMIYGADYSAPAQVGPGGDCRGTRTLNLPLEATGDDIRVVAAAHLASADDYGEGNGASSASVPFGLELAIGDETAAATLDPEVVSVR